MKYKFLILVLFQIIWTFTPTQASVCVEKLENNWLVYHKSYNSFVPYIDNGASPMVIYYHLELGKFKNDTLQFFSDYDLTLYVNYKLIYRNNERGRKLVKIPINRIAESQEQDSLVLAFYDQKGLQLKNLKAEIHTAGMQAADFEVKNQLINFVNLHPRLKDNWSQIFVFALVVTILLLVFNKLVFPGEEIAKNINKMFFMQKIDILSVRGVLGGANTTRLLINAILLATFFYLFLQHDNSDEYIKLFKVLQIDTNSSYFILLFWILLVNILKLAYNYLVAYFGDMLDFVQYQNYMIINLAYAMNLLLIAVIILATMNNGILNWFIIHNASILFLYLFIPISLTVLNFFKFSSHSNLYLFSYICTAEILPFLIAVKFLI